jgi:murein DD-endopeptidase MepM/ murein hydrolase activator NlpD
LGDVVRNFDDLEHNWLSGHRGVDIATVEGQVVVAAMPGVVTFAGMVAGRPVISINHGEYTTTYEPVLAYVVPGERVDQGGVIGEVIRGHDCPSDVCLHWGVKRSEAYLDPLSFLDGSEIQLVTEEVFDSVRQRSIELSLNGWDGRVGEWGLGSPARGVITSAYGMRLHPIHGVWKFHDGIDIASGCGTPLVAVGPGKVTEVYYHGGYGNRLIIDHGIVDGHHLKTGYNHAQGYSVKRGDVVVAGQVVGSMGSTGSSTGCHLHYQVWVDGSLVNPQLALP